MADVCTIMGIDLVGVTEILMMFDERRISVLADGIKVGVPCTETVGVTPGVPATATARRLRLLVEETSQPNTGFCNWVKSSFWVKSRRVLTSACPISTKGKKKIFRKSVN